MWELCSCLVNSVGFAFLFVCFYMRLCLCFVLVSVGLLGVWFDCLVGLFECGCYGWLCDLVFEGGWTSVFCFGFCGFVLSLCFGTSY